MESEHTLSWWVLPSLDGDLKKNIRRDTKQKLLNYLRQRGYILKTHPDNKELLCWKSPDFNTVFAEPLKVTVRYENRLDLVNLAFIEEAKIELL